MHSVWKIHICAHQNTRKHTQKYTRVCTRQDARTHHSHIMHSHQRARMHTYARTCKHKHKHTHTHTHTCTRTRTRTRTHTYTQAHILDKFVTPRNTVFQKLMRVRNVDVDPALFVPSDVHSLQHAASHYSNTLQKSATAPTLRNTQHYT